MQSNLLSLIIFAPLLGAAINWFVGRRLRRERFIGIVACASVGVSTIIAFYLAFKSDGALRTMQPVMDHLWTWIQVGAFRADFGLAMDRLSGIYALFVTFVGLLIHIFATGYMHGDDGYYRFFAYLNLFMFAMLTLVLADNFLLMFVGWEGVGLCSYLLIGYYLDRDEAAPAAKKAFIANRVGDWGFVLGIMLVFFFTSSLGKASISFFDKPAYGVASALNTIAAIPSVDPFSWHAIFAGGHYLNRSSAFHRRHRQERPDSFVCLAAGRDGWSDTGLSIDSCRDNGDGGRLHGRALLGHLYTCANGNVYHRCHRRSDGLVCRDDRDRAERYQESSRLFDDLPALLHVSRFWRGGL